jgi:hypothetical protein
MSYLLYRLELNQFFISAGGLRTTFHAEAGRIIYRQIAGLKTWNLMSAAQSHYIAPDCGTSGTIKPLGYTNLPFADEAIAKVPGYSSMTYPGDILSVPPYYYHDVYSHGTPDDVIISVSGRIRSMRETILTSPLLFTCLIVESIKTQIIQRNDPIFSEVIGTDRESFEKNVQNVIARTWLTRCLGAGRTDCVSPP